MSEPTIDALCQKCGHTFTAFLKDMADKNAQALCPHCSNPDPSKIATPQN